jgi:hypothetical protein
MYCRADIVGLEELLALEQNQRGILEDQPLALEEV